MLASYAHLGFTKALNAKYNKLISLLDSPKSVSFSLELNPDAN